MANQKIIAAIIILAVIIIGGVGAYLTGNADDDRDETKINDVVTFTETHIEGETEDEVKFLITDPDNGTVQWISGTGDTLLDAWDDAATSNGIEYGIGENPQYPGQLSTINGVGNTGTGMSWWKTYVSEGSNLTAWNISYSQTGVVLADHAASEFPYFAFVWGTWETWPNPWGMGTEFTVLPEDCPL